MQGEAVDLAAELAGDEVGPCVAALADLPARRRCQPSTTRTKMRRTAAHRAGS
jgi:hypothetical protein